MRREWCWAALVLLVAAAGCAGLAADDPDQGPTATPEPTATDTPTPTPEPVDPDNPYEKRVLTVYASYSPPELREALDYWEQNGEEYLSYPVEFEFTDVSRAADIQVEFTSDVGHCGGVYTIEEPAKLGCAPIVDSPDKAGDVTVTVTNTLVSGDTTELLKHELGHALGLDHGDEPAGVMEETQVARPEERTIPYALSVDSSYDSREVEDQIGGVEEYVNGGSDGALVPDVTMERVDNRSEAFLHISVEGEGACDGNLSCTADNYECSMSEMCLVAEEDGEVIEEAFTITTSNIRTDHVAYAVAYELHAAVFYRMYYIEEMPEKLTSEETDFGGEWWGSGR